MTFNDSVLKASLLRAARKSDLMYVVDAGYSKRMSEILLAELEGWPAGTGDALPEMLLALATNRLRLCATDGAVFSIWVLAMNPKLNELLDQLPDADYQKLLPNLRLISLVSGQELYAPGAIISKIYFPVAYVQDVDVRRLQAGQSAFFVPDSGMGPSLGLVVEKIHSDRVRTLSEPELAANFGGSVMVRERMYEGKCYAVAYFDLADNVVGRAGELHDFQERILGDDFFGSPGDLRWNKYLYIVAGPKSRSHDGFENAKAFIESDKEYARKRVVSVEDLEALLGAVQHFKPSTANKDYNVVAEWEKRLAAAGLDELLDRPTRKSVEVLIAAALPTAIRIGKVGLDAKDLIDGLVIRKLLAVVHRQSLHPGVQGQEPGFNGSAHQISRLVRHLG